MPRIGLVLGTGLTDLPFVAEPLTIETPHGDVEVAHAHERGADLFLVPRHGTARRPAHVVPHRANVDALARCRVDRVVALNTVGALVPTIPAGSFVVPDDLLDLSGEKPSFFDDASVHVDLSEPYCPTVRAALVEAARAEGAPLAKRGVYAATRGPRLETRAEVRALRTLGAHVVGMTGGAEAGLARERCLCYASLCLVTNPASGVLGETPSAEAVRAGAKEMAPRALRLALRAAVAMPSLKDCACPRSLDGARL